jgi:copper chaperone NosL
MNRSTLGWALVWLIGCSQGPTPPAPLASDTESCRHCRMLVSQVGVAAQLVAPGEEPLFFDDIGCLRDFLRDAKELPRGTIAYVADHRSQDWVAAAAAIYSRVDGLETPMGSHLIAHADRSSLAADRAARGAATLTPKEVFGPAGPPAGS